MVYELKDNPPTFDPNATDSVHVTDDVVKAVDQEGIYQELTDDKLEAGALADPFVNPLGLPTKEFKYTSGNNSVEQAGDIAVGQVVESPASTAKIV